ncbi:hypothetical protein HIM_05753 [Hirsutella minnesotensis 3608]|uniref:C3H1-type domain-containing protein n=1 Tax=Hirsutella minnesotensis 3608 TaxID=1043627 RepID=A0A0F8A576_9HYPO|nr:hypothetical protein HIM_05753 [Hirsutella minnesotensis 3608]
MPQKGRGRNGARGFNSTRARANTLRPPFAPLPLPPQVVSQGQANTLQTPYQYPRNGIPGLGLDFSMGFSQLQSTWAMQLPQTSHLLVPSSIHGPNMTDSQKTTEHASEEGEISEGEIEDIYDPQEASHATLSGQDQTRSQALPNAGNDADMTDISGVYATSHQASPQQDHVPSALPTISTAPPNTARDRSGSYSPYLSPREIEENSPAQILSGQTTGSSALSESLLENNVLPDPSVTSQPMETVEPGLTESPSNEALTSAKRNARNAIMKLVPYNIQFDTFLEEGVDRSILDSLFTELGLEKQKLVEKTQQESVDLPDDRPAGSTSKMEIVQSVLPSAESAIVGATKSQDKSEERKDRIARLLAAKSSKTTSSSKVTTVSTPNIAKATSEKGVQPSPKLQSEKSRLLQQKMEALRKSREDMARIRSQQQSSNVPSTDAQPGNLSLRQAAAVISTQNEPSLDPPEPHKTTAEPGNTSQNPLTSPPIPGLYLSSTPKTLQQFESLMQERVATPLSSDSSAKVAQRPFNQQTESKPFLINVSDDEDDTEMDIDSPGNPSSLQHLQDTASPNRSFPREPSSAIHNIKLRNVLTPNSVATPPRSSSHHSGEDLESMNKKIEAMKRKIAEAEARKKTKASRQASPAGSHPDSSRGTSTEPTRAGTDQAETESMARNLTPLNNHSVKLAPATLPRQRTGRILKQRLSPANRRSRSLVASERLPLIEARRKEQLKKLQSLQSQITRLEQEIADGEREEETLKQDLVESGSEREGSASHNSTASSARLSPVETGQPVPMDTASASPAEASSPDPAFKSNEADEPTTTTTGQNVDDSVGHEFALQPSASVDVDVGEATEVATTTGRHDSIAVAQPSPEMLQDVTMEDHQDPPSEEAEGSDGYEPPEADARDEPSPDISMSPASVTQSAEVLPESAHSEGQSILTSSPVDEAEDAVAEQPAAETDRSVANQKSGEPQQARQESRVLAAKTQFVPYETPLQYFRAYRFHPDFQKSVAGGLRSLTYSNKIDVRKEVCPDELAGVPCPRGKQCEYQHFENMKAPDDQILLQLGAAGSYQDAQKQEYIAGLRQLLTDFRNRKVKDFNAISQGIIDYRAQFLGDKSKILPLGGVTI